jgi:hypothetical protein
MMEKRHVGSLVPVATTKLLCSTQVRTTIGAVITPLFLPFSDFSTSHAGPSRRGDGGGPTALVTEHRLVTLILIDQTWKAANREHVWKRRAKEHFHPKISVTLGERYHPSGSAGCHGR